jgi:hypothetical protein
MVFIKMYFVLCNGVDQFRAHTMQCVVDMGRPKAEATAMVNATDSSAQKPLEL